ncbi:MMPL family transporter [Methanonatronarchaeum sp. AMET-Sl]|uniref:MMPL family transporter n=1 Tax=Methanonatronarchaeum sp. AMET-Sl TaxID=3037654 RepID=UPI00244E1DE5|nr:MMPL family transporter [Methanonatronarchaeum sp. AMET-Sl]WGI17293.1 MMPL family transporter [Methanonatronarchaeum sp. AMET-Sl]
MVKKEDITDLIIENRRTVIVVLAIISLIMAVGALNIETSTDLEDFEVDNIETEKMEYIQENFTTDGADEDQTEIIQLIFKGDNVLDRESLENSLHFQKELHENYAINQTLQENGITDIANFIPLYHITENKTEQLEEKAEDIENRSEELEKWAEELEEWEKELSNQQYKQYIKLENQTKELNESKEAIEEYREIEELNINETAEDPIEITIDEDYITDFLSNIVDNISKITEKENKIQDKSDEINQELDKIHENSTKINQTNYEEEIENNTISSSTAIINETTQEIEENVQDFEDPAQRDEQLIDETKEKLSVIEDELEIINETANELGNETEFEYEIENISSSIDEIDGLIEEVRVIHGEIEDEWRDLAGKVEEDLDSIDEIKIGDPDPELLESEIQSIVTQVIVGDFEEDELVDEFWDELKEGEFEFAEGEIKVVLDENIPELVNTLEKIEEILEELDEIEEEEMELKEENDELDEALEELDDDIEEVERLEEEIMELEPPSIERQIEIVENMSDEEFKDTLDSVLQVNGEFDQVNELLPMGYVEGSLEAESRMMLVELKDDVVEDIYGFDEIEDVQIEIKNIAEEETDEDILLLSTSLIDDEIDRAMEDTLSIIAPLAILLVLGLLILVYRDLFDIFAGMFGIGLVILWTYGFMGIAGIKFNQMFVAVPALMIGLSIDYAIHVFMRYREQRERADRDVSFIGRLLLSIPGLKELFRENVGSEKGMRMALPAVGLALALVTITTAIGFLANLTSNIPPVREFGVVNAFGVFSALIIFGALIPAIKIELDTYLESKGKNRIKKAFGKGGGSLSKALGLGSSLAKDKYMVVVVLAVFLAGAGVVGALYVDTTFEDEDFLPQDDSGWVSMVLDSDDYHTREAVEHINENFIRTDLNGEILFEGNITDDDALLMLNKSEEKLSNLDVVAILPDGEPDLDSPLELMQDVKEQNETFNETYHAADTTGDGIPNKNITTLYDKLFEIEEDQASEVIHKVGDEYKALLITVSVLGDASDREITEEFRDLASAVVIDGVDATATGTPIVMYTIQDQVLETVLDGLIAAFIAVLIFLMVMYRLTAGSALLGFFTTLPVLLAVSWILGTMYLLNIPFNVITGTITSLTIGLGVAYSIHITERFNIETIDRDREVDEALDETVLGTGGALLGSAATTISGFGVLIFSIITPLREFGLVAALSILYAFLASVIVLPSLIKIWSLYIKSESPENLINRFTTKKEPDKGN